MSDASPSQPEKVELEADHYTHDMAVWDLELRAEAAGRTPLQQLQRDVEVRGGKLVSPDPNSQPSRLQSLVHALWEGRNRS